MAKMLRAYITGVYLLHNVMAQVKAPTQEFSQNHLVAFEVPPYLGQQDLTHA